MMELCLQMVCIPSSPRSADRLPVDGRVSLQWHVQRLHAWMSASTLLRQDWSHCQHCDCDTTCVTGTGGEKVSLWTRTEWVECGMHSFIPLLQLNSTMRIITGTMRSTSLPWLRDLSDIEPPPLRRKPAVDKLIEKTDLHAEWPLYNYVFLPAWNYLPSRRPLWTDTRPTNISQSAKATARPDESGAWQQPTCPCGKRCHILSTAAQSKLKVGCSDCTQLAHCYRMAEDIRLVNALDNNNIRLFTFW